MAGRASADAALSFLFRWGCAGLLRAAHRPAGKCRICRIGPPARARRGGHIGEQPPGDVSQRQRAGDVSPTDGDAKADRRAGRDDLSLRCGRRPFDSSVIQMTPTILLLLAAMMQPSTQPASPLIRVMSFNIRYGTAKDGENDWSHRREMLFRTIERNNPDLLGTQEALAMQVKELKERFPGYGFVGVGRDDGKEAGEFAGLFYRSARFQLVDQGHFWLSEHPEKPGSVSWDSALTRMATWVKLRDKSDGGREFLYLNTHWDHRGEKARLESAKLIRIRVKELAAGLPCIITADLNAEDNTPEYRELLGDDLRDIYRVAHPAPSKEEATFHEFKGTKVGDRIDFVLTTREFEAVDAQIDRSEEGGHFPSDHFPVVAEVRYGQPRN